MKKTSFLLIYPIVVLFNLSPVILNAQHRDIAFNSYGSNQRPLSNFEKMGFKGIAHGSLNIKAVRDFEKTFKSVSNNIWSLTNEGGAESTFTSNGITTTVLYDETGHREYIIRIYEENNLPADIRHRVKSEYYDATITVVKEVKTKDGLIFFVHMHDKNSWKIVSIADGEMKLIEDYKKG